MNIQTRQEIKNLIKSIILIKLNSFQSETEHKPFFQSLFSDKEILTGSVIQSLYTTFGMSVYEQLSVILAKNAGFYAERQYTLLGEIDNETEQLIHNHCVSLKTKLKNKESVIIDKEQEIKMIASSILPGSEKKDGDSTVDVYIKKPSGEEFFIDITTVKNNLKSFETLKEKLLRWVGLRLSTTPTASVNTLIAIPYNPYYPADYIDSRWNATILDRKYDILIQEDYWNFVGNDPNTYTDLLNIFTEVGKEISEEISEFFNKL